MIINNDPSFESNIPVFATTSGAACYKVGEEMFVDLIFMRSHFVVDAADSPVTPSEDNGLRQQTAEMVFTKVGAVTMTAQQARDLIKAVQHQLDSMPSK
ncbi:hypothetical protein M1D48_12095 [Erwinia sp. D4-22]